MAHQIEELVEQNARYFQDAQAALLKVARTVQKIQWLRWERPTCECDQELAKAAPEYRDGVSRATDCARCTWTWTASPRHGGTAEGDPMEMRCSVVAIYHGDGSIEIRSAHGENLIADPEGPRLTAIRSVVLSGEQELGRKSLLATLTAAVEDPVRVLRERFVSAPFTRVDDPDEEMGAYGRDQRNW